MTEEQLNNTDKPELVDWAPSYPETIKAINRLLDSDEVQDDNYADALVVKAFIVSVADEMAAMSTAYNSLHERYLNSIHAAHDNR